MKKVALHTLGCKLNYAETTTLGRQFREQGYEVVPFRDEADIIVLNTCSVTERADRECRQLIRRARRRSPRATVVVTGCYAQLQPREVAAIPGVDLVLGTAEKADLVRITVGHHRQNESTIMVSDVSATRESMLASSAGSIDRTRAFLKVQDGCDYTCSFCTIPLARGPSRSVAQETVIRQAEKIAEEGHKEVVLTGVNVGDYDDPAGNHLEDVLKSLVKISSLHRIRISSIEPNLLSDSLLDVWMSHPKLCRHFHMPLQSGSDDILRGMQRRYTRSRYQDRVERILTHDPEAAIGADVIVGFPGESDDHFLDTYKFIADLPVSYLHVFPYSERESTKALTAPGRVEPRIRYERAEKLRAIGMRKRKVFHDRFEGSVQEVLVESADAQGSRIGLTGNYMKVRILDAHPDVNTIQSVLVGAYQFEEGLSHGLLTKKASDQISHALAS